MNPYIKDNPELLKAAFKTLEKWLRYSQAKTSEDVERIEEDMCAYCLYDTKHNPDPDDAICRVCPIYKITDHTQCDDTPWIAWNDHAWCIHPEDPDDTFRRLAREEYEFLWRVIFDHKALEEEHR